MSKSVSRLPARRRPAPLPPPDTSEVPLPRGLTRRWEVAAYGGLISVALLLRLVALGDRPYHHDESQDAYFSWLFFTQGSYRYNPILHGPLRFFLNGSVFFLAGVSDFTARIAPALAGTALVSLPFFLRHVMGRIAAFAAAALLCLSPAFLYYSRFAREDIYVACLTLALLIATFRFIERPHRWLPSVILGLLAASFATKETTYITVFVAGTFFIGALAWQIWQAGRHRLSWRNAPLIRAVRSVGADAWIWAAVAFIAVYTVLFTTFFFNPGGLFDGIVRSVQYWLSQQPVQRGSQPWFYYLVLLVGYDWPELIIGAIGAVVVFRRPTLFGVFLVWAFLASLAIYTWAGEKMPWLWLHPLLPLILLAAIGLQAIWKAAGRDAMIGLGVAAVGGLFLLHSTTALSFDHPADPREILVFTQSSTDVTPVRDQVVALERRVFASTGQHLRLDVDSWGGASFPWAWYFRDYPIGFIDMSSPGYAPTSQALIVTDSNHGRVAQRLTGYTGYRFRLRAWWVQDYGKATARDWFRWMMWRTPWNPEGSFDEWLYVRTDVPGLTPVS